MDRSWLSEMSVVIWSLQQWLFTYKNPFIEKESRAQIQFFPSEETSLTEYFIAWVLTLDTEEAHKQQGQKS